MWADEKEPLIIKHLDSMVQVSQLRPDFLPWKISENAAKLSSLQSNAHGWVLEWMDSIV